MRLHDLRDGLKTRFPNIYWKARNTLALGEWYWRRFFQRSDSGTLASPYDDQFWDLHDSGDWNQVAQLLLNWFQPKSVMDLGCGDGKLIGALRQIDSGLKLHGFDSSISALNKAKNIDLPVTYLNLVSIRELDIDAFYKKIGPFDLAICLEVIEHIPPWYSHKLLRFLTHCNTIIFSAAHPLQGGTLHVNEQPADYWIEKFKKLGFDLLENNELFRAEFGKIDVPYWYHQNIQVLRARHMISSHV